MRLYFALEQHAKLHHLVRVARTFEGLLLVHVLSWTFTWKIIQVKSEQVSLHEVFYKKVPRGYNFNLTISNFGTTPEK